MSAHRLNETYRINRIGYTLTELVIHLLYFAHKDIPPSHTAVNCIRSVIKYEAETVALSESSSSRNCLSVKFINL